MGKIIKVDGGFPWISHCHGWLIEDIVFSAEFYTNEWDDATATRMICPGRLHPKLSQNHWKKQKETLDCRDVHISSLGCWCPLDALGYITHIFVFFCLAQRLRKPQSNIFSHRSRCVIFRCRTNCSQWQRWDPEGSPSVKCPSRRSSWACWASSWCVLLGRVQNLSRMLWASIVW